MDENRRGFLKKAGCTALGLGCGFPLLSTGCDALRQVSADAESSASQWAMIVDVRKCLNEQVRRACREACNHAHNVPFIPDPDNPRLPDLEEEVKWIWTAQYEHVFPDQTHAHTDAATREAPVLVLCNHCTKPSCVKVCPTGATWKRKTDGLVMMDMHRCIGCRYCMAACPYGARSFNWRDPRERDPKTQELLYFEDNELPADYPARSKGVVEKCTFCAERIRQAKGPEVPTPACVEAANEVQEGALRFGNLGDPEFVRILEDNNTICRRVSLGTGPNVFYIV